MGFIEKNLPEILQIGGCFVTLLGTALMPRATKKYIKMEEEGFETNRDQVRAIVKCYGAPITCSIVGTSATLTGCYIQHENVKSLRGEIAIATSTATTLANAVNGYKDYISEKDGKEKAKEVHKDIMEKAKIKTETEKVPYIPEDDCKQAINVLKVYPCTDGILKWYTSYNKLMFDIYKINNRLKDEGYLSYAEVCDVFGIDIPPFARGEYEDIGFNRYDGVEIEDVEDILHVSQDTGELGFFVKYRTDPHLNYKTYA